MKLGSASFCWVNYHDLGCFALKKSSFGPKCRRVGSIRGPVWEPNLSYRLAILLTVKAVSFQAFFCEKGTAFSGKFRQTCVTLNAAFFYSKLCSTFCHSQSKAPLPLNFPNTSHQQGLHLLHQKPLSLNLLLFNRIFQNFTQKKSHYLLFCFFIESFFN